MNVAIAIALVLMDVGTTTWLVESLIPTIQFSIRNSWGAIDYRNDKRHGNIFENKPTDAFETHSYSLTDSATLGGCLTLIVLPTMIVISISNKRTTKWALVLPFVFNTVITIMALSIDMLGYTLDTEYQLWIKSVVIAILALVFVGCLVTFFVVTEWTWLFKKQLDEHFANIRRERLQATLAATENEMKKLQP